LEWLGFQWRPFSSLGKSGFYIKPMIRSGYSGLIPSKSHIVIIPSIETGYSFRFKNGLSLYTGLSVNYLFVPQRGDAWIPNFPIPLLQFGLGYM
jgi:hypothetical protein